ncbi:hypothetical protein [Candidatus Kuenenia sp.]|uniref:hypothetical protein n=1 Tax=Candidatus Kuenenia sp. TaxID=2499824 RepID=UPI00321F8DF7
MYSADIADNTITASDLATNIDFITTGTMSVAGGNFVVDNAGSMTASVITTAGTLTASDNLNIDSGALFVDSINNSVGIGTTTPQSALSVINDAVFLSKVSVETTTSLYELHVLEFTILGFFFNLCNL